MPTPRPGRPITGSRTGRPIVVALDLLGRRWTLRVLWELRNEPLTFRALQDHCDGMSPSVLNLRLGELREAGIVELGDAGGYCFSPLGRALFEALGPLNRWAKHWGRQFEARTGAASVPRR